MFAVAATKSVFSPHPQTDWNDGLAASALAKVKGAPVPGFHDMSAYPQHWTNNLESALHGAKKIGVNPVMEAR